MTSSVEDLDKYNNHITKFRANEYPMLQDATYLDHAGTTLYSKSLIEEFSQNLISNLYGNPHSFSASSQHTSHTIDQVRRDALRLFNADPRIYDLIFVANATAGIKLVMNSFQDQGSFWYGYHVDSHTSLVGVRQVADESYCFESDQEVWNWIDQHDHHHNHHHSSPTPGMNSLFAYPAQSNMNGRRLPLEWCQRIRTLRHHCRVYTLLDASSFVSTSFLNLQDCNPDFVVLSFYKIFGFPDLGALIIRKDAIHDVCQHRRYFGGGTVDMVTTRQEQWHVKKSQPLHESLEDGTLPYHNIVALGIAIKSHSSLFGSFEEIAAHTKNLSRHLLEEMNSLRHSNGKSLCRIYSSESSSFGPIVAFNLCNSKGQWINNSEVEKLAIIRNIHLRSGSLCNPGGISKVLELYPWEMKQNFSAGLRCGDDADTLNGNFKPSGMIRISFGAMSITKDVETFLQFLRDFFLETHGDVAPLNSTRFSIVGQNFSVKRLIVYPVKSCGGWEIPPGQEWNVRPEGLALDREWCLINQVTGVALSQKQHPKMALIKPKIDLVAGILTMMFQDFSSSLEIDIPLSSDSNHYEDSCTVCGDRIVTKRYLSAKINNFFSSALGFPCQLARFQESSQTGYPRLYKSKNSPEDRGPMMFSNESPILIISQSSLNDLNSRIKIRGGKMASFTVFRPNVVIEQDPTGVENPYVEDRWSTIQIGQHFYSVLGPCRRCQVVCVDQSTAKKDQEPFVTLAQTRRSEGKVWFGFHTCYLPATTTAALDSKIKIGDVVRPCKSRIS